VDFDSLAVQTLLLPVGLWMLGVFPFPETAARRVFLWSFYAFMAINGYRLRRSCVLRGLGLRWVSCVEQFWPLA
jgi:hypothetical protein